MIARVSAMSMLISACTHLQAPDYDTAVTKASGPIASGWTYYLAQRAFHIEVAATLSACSISEDRRIKAEVVSSAAVSDRLLPDQDAVYVIDASALSGGTKTTSLAVSLFENGTLKSINVGAQDKSADIALNLIKTGLSVAAIASGNPGGAIMLLAGEKAASSEKPNWFSDEKHLCKPEVENDLKAADILKKRLDESKNADRVKEKESLFKKSTEEIALAAAMRRLLEAAIQSGDAQKVESLRNALHVQEVAVEKAKAAAKSETADIAADLLTVQKRLRLATTIDWIPKGTSSGRGLTPPASAMVPPSAMYQRWLTPAGACLVAWDRADDDTKQALARICEKRQAIGAEIWAMFPSAGIDIRLDDIEHPPSHLASPSREGLKNAKGGIVYRQPRIARLTVCVPDCKAASSNPPLLSALYGMPQFGRLSRLDMQSNVFGDDNLAATFAADGALLTAAYTSSAELEKASRLLLDSAQSVGKFVDARDAHASAAPSRELEAVKVQTQLYEELKKLEEAKRAYDASRIGNP